MYNFACNVIENEKRGIKLKKDEESYVNMFFYELKSQLLARVKGERKEEAVIQANQVMHRLMIPRKGLEDIKKWLTPGILVNFKILNMIPNRFTKMEVIIKKCND